MPPLKPLDLYGYVVVYKSKPDAEKWIADQDDEYRNLPAHYPSLEEALDRVEFMRSKGIEARVAALLAEPTDTADEFERHRIVDD